jgi:hypothetical protein
MQNHLGSDVQVQACVSGQLALSPAGILSLHSRASQLDLSAQVALLEQHYKDARATAAKALAITMRHGTFASYLKARGAARSFQNDLEAELKVPLPVLSAEDVHAFGQQPAQALWHCNSCGMCMLLYKNLNQC